jgi:hypothetical protein
MTQPRQNRSWLPIYDEAADIALMRELAFDENKIGLGPYDDAALKAGNAQYVTRGNAERMKFDACAPANGGTGSMMAYPRSLPRATQVA